MLNVKVQGTVRFALFLEDNTGDETKGCMTEKCYENINLRPPEVGALLRGVSDCVRREWA